VLPPDVKSATLVIMARRAIEIGAVGRRAAENLARLREHRHLNYTELSDRLKRLGRPLNAETLGKIERRERRVDVDDLVALAVALDTTPNRLLLVGESGAIHTETITGPGTLSDGTELDLTPVVRVPVLDAWLWAVGDHPLVEAEKPVTRATEERANAFRRENRPHDPGEMHYFDKRELRKHPELIRQARVLVRAARLEEVGAELLSDFITLAAMAEINGDTAPSSPTTAGEPMTEPAAMPEPPATKPQRPAVITAIVTSPLGVLVGKRNDGKPPWTFIAGENEPGESPADTIVREVKEETGLRITAGDILGERVHPKTGRHMVYVAASPEGGSTKVFVGDEDELAEVRWVGLAEADELLPGMFEPVREHLARVLES